MFHMNRSILSVVAGAATLLAACSAAPPQPAPEPFFTAPVVDVRGNERAGEYWETKFAWGRYRPTMVPSDREPCWFAKIDFIIDSNGNVFNPEIVEIRPDERFARDALRMLAMNEYTPAETNPDRVPVHSTVTLEIKVQGHSCDPE